MENLTIREATIADHEGIRNITLVSFSEYAELMRPDLWEKYSASLVSTLEEMKGHIQIVAEFDGEIIGSVSVVSPTMKSNDDHTDVPWAEIRMLAVSPSFRRRGLGEALVHECEEQADVLLLCSETITLEEYQSSGGKALFGQQVNPKLPLKPFGQLVMLSMILERYPNVILQTMFP